KNPHTTLIYVGKVSIWNKSFILRRSFCLTMSICSKRKRSCTKRSHHKIRFLINESATMSSRFKFFERGLYMLHKKTNKKINKYVMLLLTAVLCIGLLSACGKDDELNPGLTFADVEGGEVVATYKDGSVTDKEFNKFKSALALTQDMDPSILDMEGYREYILEKYNVYKVVAGKEPEEQQTEAKDEALANFTQFEEILKGSGDVNEQLKSYD